jgi:hypothetical protein
MRWRALLLVCGGLGLVLVGQVHVSTSLSILGNATGQEFVKFFSGRIG